MLVKILQSAIILFSFISFMNLIAWLSSLKSAVPNTNNFKGFVYFCYANVVACIALVWAY